MGSRSAHVPVEVERLLGPLTDYVARKLELVEDDARVSVEHLIRAEQAGKSSHGLIRVSYTTSSGKFGPYGGVRAPRPERISPGRLHVDGAGHFGYPTLHHLIEGACDEALSHGTCLATSASVYPSGAIGDWARQACSRGVGVLMVASSPVRVAPTRGSSPVVGTNPICIGIPTKPLPYIGDCATSEITHGTLLLARNSGESLPTRSAVGRDGRPETSAALVHPSQGEGALLPFGGHHKAFALSMGIELLVSLGGGLPGGSLQTKNAVFGFFLGPSFFSSNLTAMSEWLERLDQEGVRVPGWVSGRRALAQQHEGIVQVPAETWSTISALLPGGKDVSGTGRRREPRGARRVAPRRTPRRTPVGRR